MENWNDLKFQIDKIINDTNESKDKKKKKLIMENLNSLFYSWKNELDDLYNKDERELIIDNTIIEALKPFAIYLKLNSSNKN